MISSSADILRLEPELAPPPDDAKDPLEATSAESGATLDALPDSADAAFWSAFSLWSPQSLSSEESGRPAGRFVRHSLLCDTECDLRPALLAL